MTDPDKDNDEKALIAAEYALGLLSPDEEKSVSSRARQDPDLQAEIDSWNDRFTRFIDELSPIAPPETVWTNVKGHLRKTRWSSETKPNPAKSPKSSFWENTAFWRGLSFASLGTTAVASFIAVLVSWELKSITQTPAQDRLVAALEAVKAEDGASFVATYDPLRKQLIIVPATLVRDTQRVPELWLVTKDERVISLGVVDSRQAQVVVIPPDLIKETNSEAGLVITLEPPGGAPGGVATGPAIAKGELSPI